MHIVCAFALGFTLLSATQAQDGRVPGRGRFPGVNIGFAALDANGDGILDANEIASAPMALARLDKNGDGQITSDEVRMSLPQGRGPGGEREGRESEGPARTSIVEDTVNTLMAFDANGDGKLSRSELPERFQGIFDRGDENKDGFLTPDEIRKVAAAQAAPPQSGEPGRDGERGGRPRREMNFVRMDPILAAVDTDGDGILSAAEIRDAANAIRKLDKDGDGRVTREEAMPAPGQRRQF
jgi:Ca2+-binding EF-hand superfamily protein